MMERDDNEHDPAERLRRLRRRLLGLSATAADDAAVRDALLVAAAWLEEANDRIPRLLAGAPAPGYDAATFAAEELASGRDLEPTALVGRLRRAADRCEVMLSEVTPADLADEPDVRDLIERVLGALAEAAGVAAPGPGDAA